MSQHQLILPGDLESAVSAYLLDRCAQERLAVVFAGRTHRRGAFRLLARDVWLPEARDYRIQSAFHIEMQPTWWAHVAKRARETGESLVVAHSHPGDPDPPDFSPSDDWGETQLLPKLTARAAGPHATTVWSPGGVRGRLHLGAAVRPLVVTGPWSTSEAKHVRRDERFARQVLALGARGQARLRALRVAVVGMGGLGSHVVEQLLHLGIGELLAIDPDRVDSSNLSRLIGARQADADAGIPKVQIAERLAQELGGPTLLRTVAGDVRDANVAMLVSDQDVVFGCTDTQWSRVVLNAIAHQNFVPVIDLGVELQASGAMGGRLIVLGPDDACLFCASVLSEEVLRSEQLPPEMRREHVARRYVSDVDVPQPAVVSLNGILASLGVTELLRRVTGLGAGTPPSMLVYRLADGATRRVRVERRCPTCTGSSRGSGELVSLPARAADLSKVPSLGVRRRSGTYLGGLVRHRIGSSPNRKVGSRFA